MHIHTYTHTHTHTCIHHIAHVHSYTRIHTHTWIHNTHICTYTHHIAHAHSYMHTHICTYTHIIAHAHLYTHTHVHAHTHPSWICHCTYTTSRIICTQMYIKLHFFQVGEKLLLQRTGIKISRVGPTSPPLTGTHAHVHMYTCTGQWHKHIHFQVKHTIPHTWKFLPPGFIDENYHPDCLLDNDCMDDKVTFITLVVYYKGSRAW